MNFMWTREAAFLVPLLGVVAMLAALGREKGLAAVDSAIRGFFFGMGVLGSFVVFSLALEFYLGR